MSFPLVTILRSDGTLEPGAEYPPLTPEQLVHLYKAMFLNRLVDERMVMAQRQGRIGFYVGSIGEEAAIIGSTYALKPEDWVVPCYREVGAALLRGFTVREFFTQLFGNSEDRIKGRQMPNHYAIPELRVTSISSPVGTQIPHATGLGLGARLAGKAEVALVFFGDGATSTSDFHVACNFAGVFKASTIFLCRNNQWAISMPLHRQTAAESIAKKAEAYGFEGVRVDGNDVLAVYRETLKAAEKARRGDGPTLIEALTYRQGAHSTSDDPRAYREDEEVSRWKARDPLLRLRLYLTATGHWDEEQDQRLEAELKQEIQTTLKSVELIGPPPLESMFNDVYESRPWHLDEQLREAETGDGEY